MPNGSVTFQLNVDATIIASPNGFIPANLEVCFQFDKNGNLVQPATLWSNEELNPQNQNGLGTYYLVCFYDQNGARINKVPMWWQFTEANGATVDISAMTPFASIGGNVIFYPTSILFPTPGPTTLGGVFSNAGSPSEWVRAINTNGSVTLSQPSFADISGTISPSQLPASGGSVVYSGTVTAQTALVAGQTGVLAGQLQLLGSTLGTATITAPAVAGTVANPIVFSNSISLPSGASATIPGGVLISAGNISIADTLTTAAQPTFRLTDSELTLSSAVATIASGGSVAAVRGATTQAAGGTITAGYLYGVQGKLILKGTIDTTQREYQAAVLAQLDTSAAAYTAGTITALWVDAGAASTLSAGQFDMIDVTNSTGVNARGVLNFFGSAEYLLWLNTDNAAVGSFLRPTTTVASMVGSMAIEYWNGSAMVTGYLPIYSS